MIKVLDKGHVRLIDKCGDDLRIVNFARASYGREQDVLKEGDDRLINYLMKNRHGTPFEGVDFTFHIKAPLCVVREWQRHRIASYNEISGRYVELEPEFYIPDVADVRSQVGKAGNYSYRAMDPETAKDVVAMMEEAYNGAYDTYAVLQGMGVAKEVARMVLPLALYSQFYFKTNARSLMNFISLRNASNAMHEIQKYAEAIEDIFKEALPLTHGAFLRNGRVAP